jgi:hypothetical protein
MTISTQKMGFSYFSSQNDLVRQQLDAWIPSLEKWGASYVVYQSNYDVAVPEDAFQCAQDYGLKPFVHFRTALPSAKAFNDVSLLLDIYKKWGCQYVILGDQPNTKNSWSIANWHYETLVDSFLDRFIPLAYHAVRIGLNPILAPLFPGGDYWDCAFLELLLDGLKKRKMKRILDNLTFASYGYTFHKPLSWGSGGPQRWPGSKPYETPEGQEDQIGFNNFEWVQAAGERIVGVKMPVIILDAGRPGHTFEQIHVGKAMEEIKKIIMACRIIKPDQSEDNIMTPDFNDLVLGCTFSLDTLQTLIGDGFSKGDMEEIFSTGQQSQEISKAFNGHQKYLAHYLLLPSYESGVSDVVLNKVRPIIKKLHPTMGFSLEEASHAEKVSIFPDPYLFKEQQINQLRSAGCEVEILPESGIEIATRLQM